MRYKLIHLGALLWITVQASFAQGIVFKGNMSWTAIRQQAAKENKYIFMDVGATWCVPCHMMEKDVFTSDSVAQFYNKAYICVKLQADSTAKDNQQVKAWYTDAKQIIKAYAVQAYPTYLFFSPQGELVYRGVGAMPVKEFITLGTKAMDPEQNIIRRKEAFEKHQMELAKEGDFAIELHDQGDQMASTVAAHYKTNYLDKADREVLMSPANLKFIVAFQSLIEPKDKYFDLFYKEGATVDSLLGRKGLSSYLATYIITLNEVLKPIYNIQTGKITDASPDWDKIKRNISEKYSPEFAQKIVSGEKYNYYTRAKNWKLASESGIDWVETSHLENTPLSNQVAYNTIFKHSENPVYLKTALKWIESYMNIHPDAYDVMDTYSCLLYKLGKRKKAIDVEERAIALLNHGNEDDKESYMPIFKDNVAKMKEGKPTW